MVYALGGSLGSLSNQIAVEVRTDGAAKFSAAFGYASRLAQRLEQVGVAAPVAARARVAVAGETPGIDIVVFDKASLGDTASPAAGH